MSTSPELTEDRLISAISRWLGRHIGNEELRKQLAATGTDGLTGAQSDAITELAEELEKVAPGERGHVEMVARETVEILALGE